MDDKTPYPLEPQSIGSDTYIVISKGHHDVHEFMRKVRAEGYAWPLGMPQHIWMKTCPLTKAKRDEGYVSWYTTVAQGTRGAWPATYTSEAWGEDSYESRAAAAMGAALETK